MGQRKLRWVRAGFILATGLLALSGCTQNPAASAGTQSSAPVAPALDAATVERLLKDATNDDPKAVVLGDQQLRESIPKAQQWLEDVKVTPETCGITFAAPVAEQLKNSTLGVAQTKDQLLTLASYPDAGKLAEHWQQTTEAAKKCTRYSVNVDGQVRAYHLAKQPVAVQDLAADAWVVTSSDGTDTSQQLMVRALSGSSLAGVQRTVSGQVSKQDVAKAADQLAQLLKQAEKAAEK